MCWQKKIKEVVLNMNDTPIERVSNFDFLGLTLNEHLNWKPHIDKIANKISRSIGILNRQKHFIPLHSKLHIYLMDIGYFVVFLRNACIQEL